MSSEADKYIYENAVEPLENINLFEDQKWNHIVDTTSSNGVFNSQIQFDLGTLSSMADWTGLSQSIITFPIKLSITQTSATGPSAVDINAACIKSGFHQFIDSIQVVIGGNTIQTSQIWNNIDCSYKILTEWSNDSLAKLGPTFGLCGIDDVSPPSDTVMAATSSLDNQGLTTEIGGFNIFKSNNHSIKQRLAMFNNNASTGTFGKSILKDEQNLLGKSNCQASAGSTVNNDVFVLYIQGTVRLSMLSDSIAKMPLCKGLKGFLYLNYNSASSVITSNAGSSDITSIQNNPGNGRCNPGILNKSAITWVTADLQTLEFNVNINATTSPNLTDAKPIQTNAMLHCPYYRASPEVDRSLSFTKKIRYNERFVTSFKMDEHGSFMGTLSPGMSNVKRIILYPYFTGPGSSNNNTFTSNPMLSCTDSAPFTTSPFASIKNLQLYVGNRPVFQKNVDLDWEHFHHEVASNGLEGGQDTQAMSGLLSQRTWNQLYRYHTVDLGRRLDSEDGASKSVQISCQNATFCPMSVIAILHYEREITVNTVNGVISQTM